MDATGSNPPGFLVAISYCKKAVATMNWSASVVRTI